MSGDAASLRNPGESTPGSLISNLRTERANKKLKDLSDNLESAASLLDQSDEEGDSTMDHSSMEDEGKRTAAVLSEDPMSGGMMTKGTTACTPPMLGSCWPPQPKSILSSQRNYREDKLQFPDLTVGNSPPNKSRF